MEIFEIEQLQKQHPAWQLLRAKNAPLILSFLGAHFIEENNGPTASSELISKLDDYIYEFSKEFDNQYERSPREYLEEWTSPEKGWLRKFFPQDSDEVHYDATPAIEKAYSWVRDLQHRPFIGTQSRLHTLIDLLKQMVHGTEADPEARLNELERRKAEIDAEMAEIAAGKMNLYNETEVRERYQVFTSTARELLSDFREVEENFRGLNRSVREKIAGWFGGKGELLDELVASRININESDQGKSFQSFYDFLLSESRQLELTELLDQVQALPGLKVDKRISHIHYDWADAAERTQRTVRLLSEQLRRFLEDQVWVENRRVLDIVKETTHLALKLREDPPAEGSGVAIEIDEPGLPIVLPFERPLYEQQTQITVNSLVEPLGEEIFDDEQLFAINFIDTQRLIDNIHAVVPPKSSIDFGDLLELYPLEEGAAELLAYLSLKEADVEINKSLNETTKINFTAVDGEQKQATIPVTKVSRK